MAPLLAGLARKVISPVKGTYLAGYAAPFRGCRSVRDDLTATALVLGDGTTRLALLAVDLLAISQDIGERIAGLVAERIGLPAEHVMIACSHAHTTPVASVNAAARDPQKRYVEQFVSWAVEAIEAAAETLRPIRLQVGRGEASIAVNRRETNAKGDTIIGYDPDGLVDRSLGVVQLVEVDGSGPAGAVMATLVNYTCHPTCLGPKFKFATAAWPGEMRGVVESHTGAPCLFLQGATGDLNPEHEWGKDELGAMVRLGKRVGEAVVATLATMEPVEAVPLGVRRDLVWLDIEPELARDGVTPMTYKQALTRHTKVPGMFADWLLDRFYPVDPEVRRTEDGTWQVALAVQTLRIGDVAISTQGAEVFQGIGLAVKASSPARLTLFAGYTGGMIGYLPTAEEHARGGYEVDLAPYLYKLPGRLHPQSAERATAVSMGQLEALYADADGAPAT